MDVLWVASSVTTWIAGLVTPVALALAVVCLGLAVRRDGDR